MRIAIVATDQVSPAILKLLDAATNMTEAQNAIGQTVVSNTIERFERQQAPDGANWLPSIRVQQSGGKTLQDTGTLKDSINYQIEGDSVFVGTPFAWAATHQEGKTIRAKSPSGLKFTVGGNFVTKQSVTIPKREIFGISDDDERDIEALLDEHFGGQA